MAAVASDEWLLTAIRVPGRQYFERSALGALVHDLSDATEKQAPDARRVRPFAFGADARLLC